MNKSRNPNIFTVDQNAYRIASATNCKELYTLLGSCVAMIGFRYGEEIGNNIGFMTHFRDTGAIDDMIQNLAYDLQKRQLNFRSFGKIVLVGGHKLKIGKIGDAVLAETKRVIEVYNTQTQGDYIRYKEHITGKEHNGSKRRLQLSDGMLHREYISKDQKYQKPMTKI